MEVRIEDVYKSFGDNHVLKGVSLDVHRGDILAIVGGSGSGKTVLLDHMIGNMKPDKGRVLIADHDHAEAPLVDIATLDQDAMDRIRMHWAVVFQRNALFSGTVYDNIALWLRENKGLTDAQIKPIAEKALASVGFRGEETVIDRDRDALSGGMAKRVAIARALAMDPLILFYDEPTTGLDPTSAAQIHELICATHERPHEGGAMQTTVIVTHDKDLLRRLRPRVVMLSEGKVFFDGAYGMFEKSDSPIIRPYFDAMGVLHTTRRAGGRA
ncbi:MAG TPA: ATP-binding cassette domain-containing protein [Phycisphaerales bacterium]|nr:ATP-binding cassette domain-containing protein [Phycisphaerales bacterium]